MEMIMFLDIISAVIMTDADVPAIARRDGVARTVWERCLTTPYALVLRLMSVFDPAQDGNAKCMASYRNGMSRSAAVLAPFLRM